MLIGVPKEVKDHEYRVAITPIGVHELVAHGQDVVIEKDAGVGSGIGDEEYVAAGAKILPDADRLRDLTDAQVLSHVAILGLATDLAVDMVVTATQRGVVGTRLRSDR